MGQGGTVPRADRRARHARPVAPQRGEASSAPPACRAADMSACARARARAGSSSRLISWVSVGLGRCAGLDVHLRRRAALARPSSPASPASSRSPSTRWPAWARSSRAAWSRATGISYELAFLIGVFGAIPLGLLVGLPALRTAGSTSRSSRSALALAFERLILANADRTGGAGGTEVGELHLFGIDFGSLQPPGAVRVPRPRLLRARRPDGVEPPPRPIGATAARGAGQRASRGFPRHQRLRGKALRLLDWRRASPPSAGSSSPSATSGSSTRTSACSTRSSRPCKG